jgi:polyferredoxin
MISRFWTQFWATLLTNSYLAGFLSGRIFTGTFQHPFSLGKKLFLPTKYLCVPTLNCYSCPGALFSCPVGAAQVILAGGGGVDLTAVHSLPAKLKIILTGVPLFVVGFLTLVGALFGRASCGWLCPFGWFQDIVHRVPSPKFRLPAWGHWLKYVVLLVFVILLPLLLVDQYGGSEPFFCKLICPAGTLQGGFLLPLFHQDLREQLGRLFAWKTLVFFAFLIAMVFFPRPFCATACPLGAFLGLFNRISLWKLDVDQGKCVHCGLCTKACIAGLNAPKDVCSGDCVRCLECVKACPVKAITFSGPFSEPAVKENSLKSSIRIES